MITTVYLSIGSNMGDRRGFIARAIEELRRMGEVLVSDEYCSDAVGYESAYGFINVAAELRITSDRPMTEAAAISLLRQLQKLEKSISGVPHRNADGSYRDREIDIDIIAIEGLRMESPELTLPHPRAAERDFVTTPLRQLTGNEKMRRLL